MAVIDLLEQFTTEAVNRPGCEEIEASEQPSRSRAAARHACLARAAVSEAHSLLTLEDALDRKRRGL